MVVASAPRASAETYFPLLDAKYSYAAPRHAGETRHGSLGSICKYPNATSVILQPAWDAASGTARGVLQFRWRFGAPDPEEFVGFTISSGRLGIDTVLPDGTAGPQIDLHSDSNLDLCRLSLLQGTPVSIEAIRFVLRGDGRGLDLVLKIELEDKSRSKAAVRVKLPLRGTGLKTLDIPLSNFDGCDKTAIKSLAVVVERLHVTAGIRNPDEGGFDILDVGLVDQDPVLPSVSALLQLGDRDFVAALARADFEAQWRLVNGVTGAALDRTLFADLIHWGAVGAQLATLPAAVARGWITQAEAEARALSILRFLDNDSLWGDGPAGFVGNSRGIVYRFGGIDPTGLDGPLTGTRKTDRGRVNSVECSTIDTAWLHWGILVCEAGFPASTAAQIEIRQRARALRNRTKWDEIVDPVTGQLYMAWKPASQTDGPYFATPASFGGYWASRDAAGTRALTIDFATAEGYAAAFLAIGSETHPVSPAAWYRMTRQTTTVSGQTVVLTWPGPAFTYTALAAYLDPRLGLDRGAQWGTISVDWYSNAVSAVQGLIALSPAGELQAPDAVELPDTTYQAQAKPALAIDQNARWSGTFSPYTIQAILGLGSAVAPAAIAELRRLLTEYPELWDPLAGLLDAVHPDLAAFSTTQPMLRKTGRWIQNQKWPLNVGFALLGQLNYLDDGVIWKTAAQHPVVQRATERIYHSSGTAPRQVLVNPDGGNDCLSVAVGTNLVLLPDHYLECIHLYTVGGAAAGQISRADIGQLLSSNGINVERSGGPPGLRDGVALPDGSFVVLLAGPGRDTLIRIQPNGALSLFSTNFVDAADRGDDTGFPRLAAGGNPVVLAVSAQWPLVGVSILDLNGALRHVLPLSDRPAGLAFLPGSNEMFALLPSGEILRYPDVRDPQGTAAVFASLPAGVGGQDLAFSQSWRVSRPALIAVGTDGRLYEVPLASAAASVMAGEGLEGVSGIDIAGSLAVMAKNESAMFDWSSNPRQARLFAPTRSGGRFRCLVESEPGAVLNAEASPDLRTWTALPGALSAGDPYAVLEDSTAGAPSRFYRVRVE